MPTSIDSNKIDSLHEPDVYRMGKGKDHKQYEYGNNVSIAATATTNIISHATNCHDNHTLPSVLTQNKTTWGKPHPELRMQCVIVVTEANNQREKRRSFFQAIH
ncbi:MAG: hypothetical protein V3V18_09410 [Methylococcales bacterium]